MRLPESNNAVKDQEAEIKKLKQTTKEMTVLKRQNEQLASRLKLLEAGILKR